MTKFSYLADGTKHTAFNTSGAGVLYLGSLVYRKHLGNYALESAAFDAGRFVAAVTRRGESGAARTMDNNIKMQQETERMNPKPKYADRAEEKDAKAIENSIVNEYKAEKDEQNTLFRDFVRFISGLFSGR